MTEATEDPLAEAGQAIGSALRTGAVAAGELVRMRLLRQAYRDHEAAQEARADRSGPRRRAGPGRDGRGGP